MAMAKSIPTFALRLMALGATISATIVMVTSHDSATVLNLKFDAKYTNSPSFKYFVIINAIASGYGLITLFLPSKSSLWRLVFGFRFGYTIVTRFNYISSFGHRLCGEERQHSCWVASDLRPSPQVL
ncbi:uncharacterized protein family [Actinidia rufa]|uniref:CASP-like protein n=1 Tax=Actinidia rufa TaxID=165716 RepID=A0A7J0G616_9ERIC|nr:uncharacterized protein family [Actinidia rufa]